MTRSEKWGVAAFIGAVFLMIGAIAAVGSWTQETVGPWLDTLGPWRRAGLGALIGSLAALPALALRWAGEVKGVGLAVAWYLLTALCYFPAVSIPGRGGGNDSNYVRFREDAGWYAITSPLFYILTLVLLVYLWIRFAPPPKSDEKAHRKAKGRRA